jgi:hypothetical protein
MNTLNENTERALRTFWHFNFGSSPDTVEVVDDEVIFSTLYENGISSLTHIPLVSIMDTMVEALSEEIFEDYALSLKYLHDLPF